MVAAESGQTDVIKFLVEGGHCDINLTNCTGETALSKAAINGYN
jgi:hypothetical protein